MENKNEEKIESVKNEIMSTELDDKKKQQQKIVLITISALVIFLLAILIFKFPPNNKKYLTADEAKVVADYFINDNLMMPGVRANIIGVEKEYGLYKLVIDVGNGEIIESYIDKRGELFFPQSFEIDTYINPYLNSVEAVPTQENIEIENLNIEAVPAQENIEIENLNIEEAQ